MSDNSTELVNRAIELAPAQIINIGGYDYIDKNKSVEMFEPPVIPTVTVTTLSGLVKLLDSQLNGFSPGTVIVHVTHHNRVAVIQRQADQWGRRNVMVEAQLIEQEKKFAFNTFLPQEEFNIALASLFVPEAGQASLLSISGNLAVNAEARQEDDGVSQRVTTKVGITLVGTKTVVPRVTLQPYSTFREAEQPPRDFVFRVQSSETAGNKCALFEADGGYWKIKAMENVATWLSNNLKGSEALADIPVAF